MLCRPFLRVLTLGLFAVAMSGLQARAADSLPDPDGKPADMSKPVKVFILMGQSNMVGAGKIGPADKPGTLEHAVKTKGLYPFLVDDAGNWTERKDVRNVRVMVGKKSPMDVHNNEWMTVKGKSIGPELGIGHELGNVLDAPVMILKSCIGNRSLGWDLLPPGSKGFEFIGKDKKTGKETTWVYAGYKESPNRWEKGTEPQPIGWYAGKQWDDDIANAKKVLDELKTYYPDATSFEVAGFFWWQGEKDCGDEALAGKYEENLVHLIETLRKDFNCPKAPFVMGTLGEAVKGESQGNTTTVMQAMFNVDGESGKYPQFKGNVATVYTHPMAQGGSGNGHYGGNSEVYMDVGLEMGKAMAKMLEGK
jgi:hypothetical protein